jgi:hypothetical protein
MINNFIAENNIRLYSAEADLDFIEEKLYEILFTIGINNVSLDEISIDEIIKAIRSMTPFTRHEHQDGIYHIHPSASIMNSINIFLVSNARRLWFRRQIIKWEISNA